MGGCTVITHSGPHLPQGRQSRPRIHSKRTTLGWSSVWMSALISVRASSAKRASRRFTATGRPSRRPSSTTVPPLP